MKHAVDGSTCGYESTLFLLALQCGPDTARAGIFRYFPSA